MAKNKIIYGNETLIDLTDDTVSTDNLLSGATAHDRSGASIVGSVTVPSDLDDLSDVTISSPTDGQALVYDDTDDLWKNTTLDVNKVSQTIDSTSDQNYRVLLGDTSSGDKVAYKTPHFICNPNDADVSIVSGKLTTRVLIQNSNTDANDYSEARFEIGNSKALSQTGDSFGNLRIFDKTQYRTDFNHVSTGLTADRTLSIPDKSGTIATTDDLPTNYVPNTGGTFSGNVKVETSGTGQLNLGKSDKSSAGRLVIYETTKGKYASVKSTGITGNREIVIPDKDGTLATTDDLPTDFVSKESGGTFSGNITIDRANGTTTSEGISQLSLGNNKGSTTTGNSSARLIFYGPTASVYSDIKASNITSTRHLELPNKSGTFALVGDDISTFNNDSGYVTTDNKVRQLNTTTSADYRVILSYGANSSDVTNRVHKSDNLTFNPSTEVLTIGGTASFKSTQTQELKISTNVGGGSEQYDLFFGVRNNMWNLAPVQNKQLQLGSSSYRWNEIFAANATINTSDRKEKKDIEPLDEHAKEFIMALNPVSYKFIDGKSGRTHYGMIAQDVEEEMASLGMTDKDFAGFCKDQKMEEYETLSDDNVTVKRQRPVENEYNYGLRYEEFIAPLIKTVQLQQQEIEQLKQEIRLLKGE